MRGDNMAKKNEGFHSAAGLIRYFDAEDEKSPKIPAIAVVITAIVLAVVVEFAHAYWGF